MVCSKISGEVTTSYDTANIPLDLKADVVNEGLVDIAPAAGGQLELELVKNGGFEQGVQSDSDVDYQFAEGRELWIEFDAVLGTLCGHSN